MKISEEDLIYKIVATATDFMTKNYYKEENVAVTISVNNGNRLLRHINEMYKDITINGEIFYSTLKIYGFRVIVSEMVTDEEITVGVVEPLK